MRRWGSRSIGIVVIRHVTVRDRSHGIAVYQTKHRFPFGKAAGARQPREVRNVGFAVGVPRAVWRENGKRGEEKREKRFFINEK